MNVGKTFGGVSALVDVTVSLRAGQITAIVGSNGSGKTTLLDVLSGLTQPDSGVVMIHGEVIPKLTLDTLGRCGIARGFQLVRIVKHLSIEGNVVVGLARARQGHWLRNSLLLRGLSQRDSRAVRAVLERVGLEAETKTRASDLSVGQGKILALAVCLATDPRILLLDEPVAGLDETSKDRVGEVLSGLREAGCTVVVVEHDTEFVQRIADRIVVMSKGAVVFAGSWKDCLAEPQVIDSYLSGR